MPWLLFETKWGWSGVLATPDGSVVQKLILPQNQPDLELQIVKADEPLFYIRPDDRSVNLVNRIRDYFMGKIINAWEVQLDLSGLPAFSQTVLRAVSTIPYGATSSYGEIAGIAGNPKAARAVGQIMKNNPIPLIIPCHRVLAANGWGGFRRCR